MPYFVYLIGSYKNSKIKTYVGYTNNIKKRLALHNANKGAKSTKGRKWKVIYKEKFTLRKTAMSREYHLKNDRVLRKKITKSFRF